MPPTKMYGKEGTMVVEAKLGGHQRLDVLLVGLLRPGFGWLRYPLELQLQAIFFSLSFEFHAEFRRLWNNESFFVN